jgi:hypothetical protein
MATTNLTIFKTVAPLAGGSNALAGVGQQYKVSVTGTWANGDSQTLTLTDSTTGNQTQIGAGNATGAVASFVFTFKNKVYVLAGSAVYFSELATPASFNNPQGTGNSFITLSNFYATAESQVAIASYQGFLAFIARRSVQIWNIDPDPAQNALQQDLQNVGTFAAESVQSLGDKDVVMLSDSGFRSLRPRVASLNAEVIDLGTPVDSAVQALLATLSDAEKAATCAIVEPTANRYMAYIPGHNGALGSIYVLSKFGIEGSQDAVQAWTTYSPTYQIPVTPTLKTFAVTAGSVYAWKPALAGDVLTCGTVTLTKQGIFTAPNGATTATVTGSAAGTLSLTQSFIPQRFSVYLGQVYVRAGDNVFVYGGTDNVTYDACGVSGQLPYLDCDVPAAAKYFTGMDAGFEGSWAINFSGDYNTQTFHNVYNNTVSSFQLGNIPLGGRYATHFSLTFNEVSDAYARFSSAIVHFNPAAQKK